MAQLHDTLPTFKRLLGHLQKVPYLASKNLYRVAAYLLTNDRQAVEELCAIILQARERIINCTACHNWTEGARLCAICADDRRDRTQICVVETWYDLFAVEKTGVYRGLYHVLGGALCPLDGIGPSDLFIESFVRRIDASILEVVLATNPTPEGEATASYIASLIAQHPITISKFASGLPTGSTLEYMDKVTIHQAYLGRRPF